MVLIGAHVSPADLINEAHKRDAQIVQIFLGNPQSWSAPTFSFPGGAEVMKQALIDANIGVYVHSPYLVNIPTTNNKVRIPSRKMLQQTVDAAALIGARGVVVHGGHVPKEDEPEAGFANWKKAVDQLDMKVPVLIENTAGGERAMARKLEAIAKLWDAVGHTDVGFCLDTCHAWAGGLELPDVVQKIRAITGRIDLVHANDSKDAFNSSRDRHANLGMGEIALDELVECIKAANAPVITETPGEVEEQAADIALLKKRLG
jgi:deoxyribonuclease-4